MSDFLKKSKDHRKKRMGSVKNLINDTESSFLIIDDSIQEKPYARAIELVASHYSGNKHAVIRGIDIVNLVHSSGEGSFYPIDYRIYTPGYAETKNDYFLEMLHEAFHVRNIQAKYILFDSWYARVKNLKYIHNEGRIFNTKLKSNRLVSLSKETGYVHLDTIDWTPERIISGISVKLKEVPFRVMLFKVVTTDGDIDWVITNDMETQLTTDRVRGRNAVRWDIESFHREVKQLTGIEKCQAHSARAQRNHIACCYHAWLAIKVHASKLKTTLYNTKNDLLSQYLMNELKNPRIKALGPT